MNWVEILNTIFQVAIIPIIGVLATYLISFIDKKANDMKAKAKNDTVKKYLDMLDDTIISCVMATTQTYVDALKGKDAFDEEAQKKALQLTYDAVMAILTDEAKEYLSEVVGDLQSFVLTKIEAGVAVTKK